MFKVIDKTIHVTRGDTGSISFSIKEGTEPYTFKQGEVVRFNIMERKNASNVILSKDFAVEEETQIVTINLTEQDTRIGEIINKPVNYWYEVQLNPEETPQTVIGYDINGEKLLILYPEGEDYE